MALDAKNAGANAQKDFLEETTSTANYATLKTPRESRIAVDSPKPEKNPSSLSFSSLYRFAMPRDYVVLALGVVMAAINGSLSPCMALVFGNAISAFAPFDSTAVNQAALDYFLIAVALFITDYLSAVFFANSAERQMKALRQHVFKHLLHLDISWYDTHDAMQLSSRVTGDTIRIKNGMGQKLGDAVKFAG